MTYIYSCPYLCDSSLDYLTLLKGSGSKVIYIRIGLLTFLLPDYVAIAACASGVLTTGCGLVIAQLGFLSPTWAGLVLGWFSNSPPIDTTVARLLVFGGSFIRGNYRFSFKVVRINCDACNCRVCCWRNGWRWSCGGDCGRCGTWCVPDPPRIAIVAMRKRL